MKSGKLTALLPAAAAATFALSAGGAALAQDGGYTLGVSNTVTGNGWREEMVCSIQAQALAAGSVDSLTIANRNTDAAGQLEDIRNLVAANVDAIVLNPASPEGVNPAIRDATEAGIAVVAVDQEVTEPSAYVISNDQEQYGYLGAKWLFEQLGGEGEVIYMRGAAGAPADIARHEGVQRALEEFPDIEVVNEVYTGWQQDRGKQQILDFIATGIPFDGIWTSGIDNVIVDALVESDVPLVPVVGADNAGFVSQLVNVEGLTGAAVTNPGSIGGAGVTLALDILGGNAPEERVTRVTPELWDNTTDEGRERLAQALDPSLDPEWPVSITVPGWTDYSREQIIACEGPDA